MSVETEMKNLPKLMAILNVTPDSFYDGGEYNQKKELVERARCVSEAGADILDIGGVSTRPGASEVTEDAELERVIPALTALREAGIDTAVSIDTFRGSVAAAACEHGIAMVNDVTALRADPELAAVVAENDLKLVLMHMQGRPQTMQENPTYDDVIEEINAFFGKRIEFALKQGLSEEQLILDPGVGFGKRLKHNRRLLAEVDQFKKFGLPVLVGHSRKSYLGDLLGRPVEERLPGTLATSARLILKGVDVLRVHDVKAHKDLLEVWDWL